MVGHYPKTTSKGLNARQIINGAYWDVIYISRRKNKGHVDEEYLYTLRYTFYKENWPYIIDLKKNRAVIFNNNKIRGASAICP
jgi:hypothetical protein